MTAPAAPPAPAAPVLYDCRITHARAEPVRNAFTYRSRLWLTDAGATARQHLARFLRARGVDPPGGRIRMLAHGAVLGYAFNPLTIYWCHHRDGSLACVVAEVHNTYRQRHAYLLRPDDRGRSVVTKEFYVSPFYPVDGWYRMSTPEPGASLALSVVLHRPGGQRFTASVHGTAVPVTARARLGAAWSTTAVSARIYRQGIGLYLRGLRPVPRPAHQPQEGI